MSAASAPEVQEYISTIKLGNDVVPTLSIPSFAGLITTIADAAGITGSFLAGSTMGEVGSFGIFKMYAAGQLNQVVGKSSTGYQVLGAESPLDRWGTPLLKLDMISDHSLANSLLPALNEAVAAMMSGGF